MLELGDTQLELVPLATRDETEIAKDTVERRAGALADAHRVATPARRRVVDPAPNLVLRHPASLGECLGELVCAIGRQRDRTNGRERHLAQRPVRALRLRVWVTALVHGAVPAVAAFAARASPAPPARRLSPHR